MQICNSAKYSIAALEQVLSPEIFCLNTKKIIKVRFPHIYSVPPTAAADQTKIPYKGPICRCTYTYINEQQRIIVEANRKQQKKTRRKMFEIKKRNENRMFAMPLKLYFIFIFISLFLQSTKRFSAPRVYLYGSRE